MVDILGTLEGISLQKRLKSNDPKKVIEAQDRIIADVLIHAAASTEDISILALNLGEGKLSKLSHNEMLLRLSQMLRTGEAQYVLTESGYSIKYRDNKKQEQIIRFNRNTTRQGVTGTVTVNRATKEASAQKESKDYNKKLELLEQIIQTQRQLLLKLIDEPKIISSD